MRHNKHTQSKWVHILHLYRQRCHRFRLTTQRKRSRANRRVIAAILRLTFYVVAQSVLEQPFILYTPASCISHTLDFSVACKYNTCTEHRTLFKQQMLFQIYWKFSPMHTVFGVACSSLRQEILRTIHYLIAIWCFQPFHSIFICVQYV